MASTPTTNLALNKPASADSGWGTTLNADLDRLDLILTRQGTASPLGVLTPDYINQIYIDKTNSLAYISKGLTNADWVALNPALNAGGNVLDNGGLEVTQRTATPATGTTATAGNQTYHVDRFFCRPAGASVTQSRSTSVRTGGRTRYSHQVDGAASVTTVDVGQRIPAQKVPPLKGNGIAFSVWIYNATSAPFTPVVKFGTPGAVNNFGATTNVATSSPGISCPTLTWTQVSCVVASSTVQGWANIDNGLEIIVQLPSGSLLAGQTARFAEMMLVDGATAVPFVLRNFSDEMQACEAYYEAVHCYYVTPTTAGVALAGAVNIRFRSRKIASPTVNSPSFVWTVITHANLQANYNTFGGNYSFLDTDGFGYNLVNSGAGTNGVFDMTLVVNVEF